MRCGKICMDSICIESYLKKKDCSEILPFFLRLWPMFLDTFNLFSEVGIWKFGSCKLMYYVQSSYFSGFRASLMSVAVIRTDGVNLMSLFVRSCRFICIHWSIRDAELHMIPAKVFSRRELLRRERKSTITNSPVRLHRVERDTPPWTSKFVGFHRVCSKRGRRYSRVPLADCRFIIWNVNTTNNESWVFTMK